MAVNRWHATIWIEVDPSSRCHMWPTLPTWIYPNPRIDKWLHAQQSAGCNCLSLLGLKLIHVSKRGQWHACHVPWWFNLLTKESRYSCLDNESFRLRGGGGIWPSQHITSEIIPLMHETCYGLFQILSSNIDICDIWSPPGVLLLTKINFNPNMLIKKIFSPYYL